MTAQDVEDSSSSLFSDDDGETSTVKTRVSGTKENFNKQKNTCANLPQESARIPGQDMEVDSTSSSSDEADDKQSSSFAKVPPPASLGKQKPVPKDKPVADTSLQVIVKTPLQDRETHSGKKNKLRSTSAKTHLASPGKGNSNDDITQKKPGKVTIQKMAVDSSSSSSDEESVKHPTSPVKTQPCVSAGKTKLAGKNKLKGDTPQPSGKTPVQNTNSSSSSSSSMMKMKRKQNRRLQ